MNYRELIKLIKEMREKQKQFRSAANIEISYELEKLEMQVDEEILRAEMQQQIGGV